MAEHAHTTPGTKPGDTATRRTLLAGLAGAALTGSALAFATPSDAAAESPDAQLIAGCERFCAFEVEIRRLGALADCMPGEETPEQVEFEQQRDDLAAGQMALGNDILDIKAHTVEGMRAKARAIFAYNYETPRHFMIEQLAWSLVEDLAAQDQLS